MGINKGIFITGTDTGVGKTSVAAGLIRAFRDRGLRICPMKPVETGCSMRRGKLVPHDAVMLMKASGSDEPLDLINPYRFRMPLAPAVASELENVPIEKRRIISSYNRLSAHYDLTVVEGAGGIMVPVSGSYLFVHFVKEIDIPLVIVARPGLGTLNHTLLTIEAAKHHKVNVLGVIINYAEKTRRGMPEKTNPGVIENVGGVPVLGTIPYAKDGVGGRNMNTVSDIAENILLRLRVLYRDLDPSVFPSS